MFSCKQLVSLTGTGLNEGASLSVSSTHALGNQIGINCLLIVYPGWRLIGCLVMVTEKQSKSLQP